MIEVLDWFASHPWITILLTICLVSIIGTLGGSIAAVLGRYHDAD